MFNLLIFCRHCEYPGWAKTSAGAAAACHRLHESTSRDKQVDFEIEADPNQPGKFLAKPVRRLAAD
jgi:hypothetical protein